MSGDFPDHGIEGAEDFFVSDAGGYYAYSALDDIERLHQRLIDAFTEIQERDPATENMVVLRPEERARLLEFYTVVHAHIERLCAVLLFEELADKENREYRPTIEFFRDDLNQETRLNLLFRTGIIDAGLKGELGKVKTVRNELVHEQDKRMFVDLETKTATDVDRAYNAVTALDDLLNETAGIE